MWISQFAFFRNLSPHYYFFISIKLYVQFFFFVVGPYCHTKKVRCIIEIGRDYIYCRVAGYRLSFLRAYILSCKRMNNLKWGNSKVRWNSSDHNRVVIKQLLQKLHFMQNMILIRLKGSAAKLAKSGRSFSFVTYRHRRKRSFITGLLLKWADDFYVEKFT